MSEFLFGLKRERERERERNVVAERELCSSRALTGARDFIPIDY